MSRHECTEFLQWALPRMRMRWQGYRRVRSQVCKRIARRIGELRLDGFAAYRDHLAADPREWSHLDTLCRVTISRFWRDREVYVALAREVLPALAEHARSRGADRLRCWSCGCASGEEPYSLLMAWRAHGTALFPAVVLELVASDSDPQLLERAHRGLYQEGSLRDLPEELRSRYIERPAQGLRVAAELRSAVDWRLQDLRRQAPEGRFDLVSCRNLAFTYYDEPLQLEVLRRLVAALHPGGALVIGGHERLPAAGHGLHRWRSHRAIWQLRSGGASG